MTPALATLYGVTAIACMLLGCIDVNDIYRQAARLMVWLGPRGRWYSWTELVSYGVLLIAPTTVLLFSGIGILASSASRMRVFLITVGITLPFIAVTCISHVAGSRATLYIAGPIVSIIAPLAYKRIPYEKCAFWSSATLVALRIYMIHWHLDDLPPYTLGSYVRWAECESICSGLALISVLASAIRLAYFVHAERAS